MIHIFLLVLFASFSFGFESGQIYCANKVNNAWEISEHCNRGTAVGSFVDKIQTTGWVELFLKTSKDSDDHLQAYGAGYLEGALTVDYIWDSFQTFNQTLGYSNGTWFDPRLINFVINQDKWMRDNAKRNNTPYWAQVKLILEQFDGLIAGYANYAPPNKALSYIEWLFFQLQPEWGDIESSWNWQPSSLLKKTSRGEHCSVLVRLSGIFLFFYYYACIISNETHSNFIILSNF